MRKKNVWMKRAITALLSTALTISAFSVSSVSSKAALGYWPNDLPVPNEWYYENKTLQPYGTCLHIGELINWSPDNDPDARYNRGSIPLRKRWMGPSVNPKASRDAKLYPLITSNARASEGASQGGDGSFVYAFNNFQYVDTYNFWGGSSGEGPIAIPSPEHIDSAHRNGAYATGTIFLPWGDGTFGNKFVQEMVRQNPDGSYPAGDKLIEIAQYYGFDGYIFNAESGTSVQGFKAFLEYLQKKGPENFRIAWYNGSGSINSLSISRWMQDGGNRITDGWWLDMSGSGYVDGSIDSLYQANRSPWELYSTWEYIPMAPGAKGGNYQPRLDNNGFLKSSLGVLFYTTSLTQSKDIDDFINVQDPKVWVGPTFNPASTERPSNTFCGFANMIADRTTVLGTDFTTHFIAGNGYKFYENGKVTGKEAKGWYNRSLTDVLPTWRWIIDAEDGAKKVSGKVDYSDAYFGGSSIKLFGDLDAGKSNHVKLYSSKLDMTDHTKADIVYKTPDAKNVKVSLGLCFGDDYSDANFKFYPLTINGNGQWNKATVDLSGENGKTAIAISLKVESPEGVKDYSLNLGKLSIYTEQNAPKATSKVTLDDVMYHSDKKAEVRLYWEKAEGAFTYIIHRIHPDGREEFVGATPSTAYYLLPMTKDGNEEALKLRVTSISENGIYGGSKEISIAWPPVVENGYQEAHALGTNWALNAPAYSSVRVAADGPVDKINDGVIPSSKWCGLSSSGDAYLDLGQNRDISRWIVYHANCRGAGEGKDFNTVDFSLKYAPDDGQPLYNPQTDGSSITKKDWKTADSVTNNSADVTDRNITPIKARYIDLRVDRSDRSPWTAIRIYEFELYSDPGVVSVAAPSTPLDRNVSVANVKGAADTVIIDNVGRTYSKGSYPNGTISPVSGVVKLYDSAESKVPIATETAVSSTAIQKQIAIGTATFTNLNLNPKGGRLWYTLSDDGIEGLRYSFAYPAESGEKAVAGTPSVTRMTYGNDKLLQKHYGMLTITGLNKGAKVALYDNDADVQVRMYSYPAQADGTVVLRHVPLTKTGGNLYYAVFEEGKAMSDRKAVPYGNTDEMNVDMLALRELYHQYEGYQEASYTAETWTAFSGAREALKAKLNAESVKGSEADTLRNNLLNAEALLFLKGDTERMKEFVKDAEEKYPEANYLPESYTAFKDKLAEVKAYLENPEEVAKKTNQNLVDDRVALDKAIRALQERVRLTKENVPDETLRQAIIDQTGSPYVDIVKNYDGKLDLSNVAVVNYEGLQILEKLTELDLSNKEFTTLPDQIPAGIHTLKLANCTEITTLDHNFNRKFKNLKALDLTGCSKLHTLYLANMGLEKLDVSELSAYPDLFRVEIQNNKLDLTAETPEGKLVKQFEDHLKDTTLAPEEGSRTNAALHAPATANNRAGTYMDPARLTDGDTFEGFLYPADAWAEIDLQGPVKVDSVEIEGRDSNSVTGHFDLFYATDDKKEWKPLVSYNGEAKTQNTLSVNPEVTARYIRFVNLNEEEGEILEIYVYGKKITEAAVVYNDQDPVPYATNVKLEDKTVQILDGESADIYASAKDGLVIPPSTIRGTAFPNLKGQTWLKKDFDADQSVPYTMTIQDAESQPVEEGTTTDQAGDYKVILTGTDKEEIGSFTLHIKKLVIAPPAAVQNLKIEEKRMLLNLSWDAVADADGYMVYRQAPGEEKLTYLYLTKNTKYNDKVSVFGEYTYKVFAYRTVAGKNLVGECKDAVKGIPYPVAPGAATGLRLEREGNTVRISWDYVNGADGYIIYRRAPGEDKMTVYRETTQTYYKDEVKDAGTYFYIVAAYKGEGTHKTGGVGTEYKYINVPKKLPAPVNDLSLRRNGDKVILSWSKTQNAEFYLIYRQAPGQQKMSYLYMKSDTSYVDTLKDNGFYFYTVYACRKENGKNVVSGAGRVSFTSKN